LRIAAHTTQEFDVVRVAAIVVVFDAKFGEIAVFDPSTAKPMA
jgi:hypothetical protein